MNVVINQSALVLDRAQSITLVDAAGATATVERGCVWITMDGDRRDVVLNAGDRWTVERNGITLVSAEAPTLVRITAAPRRRSAGRRLIDWLTAWERTRPIPSLARYY